MKNRNGLGFTLIELMIVVVILGVLAAIAYPSYRSYLTQTRRSDAQIALTKAANSQERFFTECNNHYAQVLVGAGRACGTLGNAYNDGILFLSTAAPVFSPDRHYVITLIAPVGGCPIASCYVLEATPSATTDVQGSLKGTGLQANDGKFRIDSLGRKFWDKNNDGDFIDTGEDNWSKK